MKRLTRIIPVLLIFLGIGCGLSPVALTVTPTLILPTATFTPVPTATLTPTPTPVVIMLSLPQAGFFYQGVFPGGRSGEEDDITVKDILSYEDAVGKAAAWVYFSNNWYHSRKFPTAIATDIRDLGSIPYIRLMLRSSPKFEGDEPIFSIRNILEGQIDADLYAWCQAARDFGSPIIAEYGTEVNSDAFAWNGFYNGAGILDGFGDRSQPDGPERFKAAYRYIIQHCRDVGAQNITWVFHIDPDDHPASDWNRLENYYPGDEWIDWIGVSIYGASRPQDQYWDDFRSIMDRIYARLAVLAPTRPIIVAEFAAPANNPLGDQAEWARAALTALTSGRYPRVIGFSWWNERWENDDNPEHDTTMRVEDNPDLAQVFQELVGDNPNVLGEINP